MAIDREKIIGAFAGAALTLGTMTGSALADYADITIRYGDQVTENMEQWADIIRDKGLSVEVKGDLGNNRCAAVISDGVEVFRFSEESIANGRMSSAAYRVGAGKRISKITKSDCQVDVSI